MRVQFGEFCLESDTRRLTRAGQPVAISPKAFQLLQFLLEKRPKALSIRELYRHLWPETFVEKANLRNLIVEIRAATDDPANAPRWIRTVFGFGYSFVGEVSQEVEEDEGAERVLSRFRLLHPAYKFLLFEGENVVGRQNEAHIFIPASGISRRHAVFFVDGDRIVLDDLSSKNGTFVDGIRVLGPVPVNDGAEIRLGYLGFVLRAFSGDAPTETEP